MPFEAGKPTATLVWIYLTVYLYSVRWRKCARSKLWGIVTLPPIGVRAK